MVKHGAQSGKHIWHVTMTNTFVSLLLSTFLYLLILIYLDTSLSATLVFPLKIP